MTFGQLGTVENNEKKRPVEAQEQLSSTAHLGAFISQPTGDLIVSERKGKSLQNYPIEPGDSEFQREYPKREVAEIVHRRLLLLVKHPTSSKMTDYLVVRDETKADVDQQLNIHLLARDAKVEGRLIDAVGQQGVDMRLFLAAGEGPDGRDPKVEIRSWHYVDEHLFGPEEYWLKEGETIPAWDARMDQLMQVKGVKELPLPGFKPSYKNAAKGETQSWLEHIAKTRGQALLPPKNWTGPWQYGEYQNWLRIETKPGVPILWVLYAYKKGDQKPAIERIDDKSVRIKHGDEIEEIFMESDGGVRIRDADGEHMILAADKLPPLGEIHPEASAVYRGE